VQGVHVLLGGGLVRLTVPVGAGERHCGSAHCSQGDLFSNGRSFPKKCHLHRGIFSSWCLKQGVNGLPLLVSPWLGHVMEHLVRPDLVIGGTCSALGCAACSCRAGSAAVAQLCAALQLLLASVKQC